MNMLAGLLEPTSGDIVVNGKLLTQTHLQKQLL